MIQKSKAQIYSSLAIQPTKPRTLHRDSWSLHLRSPSWSVTARIHLWSPSWSLHLQSPSGSLCRDSYPVTVVIPLSLVTVVIIPRYPFHLYSSKFPLNFICISYVVYVRVVLNVLCFSILDQNFIWVVHSTADAWLIYMGFI